mmetsp:Transcript_1501/g.4437  ORF Transcript_1501/g.4437 Transcript_1501/m.4437 type:complete len:233 (-) Transcript_1501:289-987(-)
MYTSPDSTHGGSLRIGTKVRRGVLDSHASKAQHGSRPLAAASDRLAKGGEEARGGPLERRRELQQPVDIDRRGRVVGCQLAMVVKVIGGRDADPRDDAVGERFEPRRVDQVVDVPDGETRDGDRLHRNGLHQDAGDDEWDQIGEHVLDLRDGRRGDRADVDVEAVVILVCPVEGLGVHGSVRAVVPCRVDGDAARIVQNPLRRSELDRGRGEEPHADRVDNGREHAVVDDVV